MGQAEGVLMVSFGPELFHDDELIALEAIVAADYDTVVERRESGKADRRASAQRMGEKALSLTDIVERDDESRFLRDKRLTAGRRSEDRYGLETDYAPSAFVVW